MIAFYQTCVQDLVWFAKSQYIYVVSMIALWGQKVHDSIWKHNVNIKINIQSDICNWAQAKVTLKMVVVFPDLSELFLFCVCTKNLLMKSSLRNQYFVF